MKYMMDEPPEVQLETAIGLLKLQLYTTNQLLKGNRILVGSQEHHLLKDRADKIQDFLISIRRL